MKFGYMLVVPLGAVLCACACLTGCGRDDSPAPAEPSAKPSAAPSAASPAPQKKDVSRVNDEAYQERVKGIIKGKQSIGKRRANIELRMAQLRAIAKKALPEGATAAQVFTELENNPKKYPAWRELSAAMKEILKEEKQNLAAAQAAVRQRIVQEAAESAANAAPAEK